MPGLRLPCFYYNFFNVGARKNVCGADEWTPLTSIDAVGIGLNALSSHNNSKLAPSIKSPFTCQYLASSSFFFFLLYNELIIFDDTLNRIELLVGCYGIVIRKGPNRWFRLKYFHFYSRWLPVSYGIRKPRWLSLKWYKIIIIRFISLINIK